MEQLEQRPDWIAGFVDGEGCFTLNITNRDKMKFGIEFQLQFSVAQNQRSAQSINNLKHYWKCGTLKNDTRSQCRVYTVKNLDELRRIIIPFFHKYPLLTQKKEDFILFEKIHSLMTHGEHLRYGGILTILDHAYAMNMRGNKRKRSKQEVLARINSFKR
jgi:hypothetical protein